MTPPAAALERPCRVQRSTGEVFPYLRLAEAATRPTPSAPAPAPAPAVAVQPDGWRTVRDGSGPLDELANQVSFADLLEPLGWTEVRPPDSQTREAWRRPGASNPVSAKVPKANPHVLVAWSEDAGLPTGAGQRLTVGRVYAHYYFGGDTSAAARALLAGDAPGLPPGVAGRIAARLADRAGPREEPAAPTGLPGLAAAVSTVVDPAVSTAVDPAEEVKARFPRTDWAALWADPVEEDWIVYPLVAAGRLVSLYSPPKAGKSLLVLELAATISMGRPFLGEVPERRYRVLYVDHENDPRGDVRARLQAMGYGPNDLDHLDHLPFPTMAPLDTAQGAAELLAAVQAYGSEVVVIDTVSRAVDGEENSNDTWLQFYRRTCLPLKQQGVALIRLDHTGKDESKGMRGGSAKAGDVDAIWKLTKVTEEKLRLDCTDSRMQLDTKSLVIGRLGSPRLHHVVLDTGKVNPTLAKVAKVIALCDAEGLPPDASREAVRECLARLGQRAGGNVVQEAIKQRKAGALVNSPAEFTPTRTDGGKAA